MSAATLALEPLLRLKGVSCDLSKMPWLPELLTVFGNVLHAASAGCATEAEALEHAKRAEQLRQATEALQQKCEEPRPQPVPESSGSLLGSGHVVDNQSTAASMGIVTAAAGGSPSRSTAQFAETCLEQLRERLQRQDAWVDHFRHQEQKWKAEAMELRSDRDRLLRLVAADASPQAKWPAEAGSEEETRWLASRVLELERQHSELLVERQATEDRLKELIGLVQTSVDAEPLIARDMSEDIGSRWMWPSALVSPTPTDHSHA